MRSTFTWVKGEEKKKEEKQINLRLQLHPVMLSLVYT